MKAARFLWLELVGCALLLAVAYGLFATTPQPVWVKSKGKGDVGGTSRGRSLEPAGQGAEATRSRAVTPRKPRPPSRPLAGQLVVIDDHGTALDRPEGTLFLRIELDDATRETHALAVHAGEFEVDVPIGSFLSADTATIAQRYAEVVLPRTALPPEGRLVVNARLPTAVEVVVEDAATATPLDDVTLLRATGPPSHDLRPIDSSDALEALGRATRSPIAIPPDLAAIDAWIDAPGYAFARLRFAPRTDGSQRVALERPATLRIAFARSLPARDTVRLQVFGSTESGALAFRQECHDRALRSSDPLDLDRLRPGSFVVRVVGLGSLPPILAEAIVTLHSGRTTEITLDPRDEPPIHLRGTLAIAAEWDPLPPTLRCFKRASPNDDWQSVAQLRLADMSATGSLRSFELDVPRSELRFELLDSGFAHSVGADALVAPLELSLPAPARLDLRFQDEAERDVEIERVRIHCHFGADAAVLATPIAVEGTRSYRARIPSGPFSIELDDSRYRFVSGESLANAEAKPGTASLRFSVESKP